MKGLVSKEKEQTSLVAHLPPMTPVPVPANVEENPVAVVTGSPLLCRKLPLDPVRESHESPLVPVVVMGPPVTPLLVAMDVTVPVPVTVAQAGLAAGPEVIRN